MGDSDDDFDSRRNRDKFRRERDDFSGNRGNNNRNSGEWNDGRDRSNQFRRQYPSGPLLGRDFPSRYNRSPAMSPPQNKRIRRDWEGLDQSPSHFDSTISSSYSSSGGNFQPSNIQSTTDQLNKESSDNATQPPMLSFKNFLLNQDDNIDQEEAVKRYNDYKIDFKKTQITEFFTTHKNEEWFKYKYYPDEYLKRRQEQKQIIKKRLEIFMDLYNKGYLNNVSVDIDNQQALIRFLDAAVIKMEGGNDQDLRVLDIMGSLNNTNDENISTDKIDNNEINSKKSSDNKRKREDSKSDDGTVSDGDNRLLISESKDNNEHEVGEVSDTSRLLHRTSSIFFRHLPIQTTKDDLENICKQYAGFRRVCITDPAPERKFSRRAWVTFDHSVQIRNICYELNLTKIHDVDMSAIINRELKNRIRTINGIGNHKTIVRNDIRLITKIIKQFDERWNIWETNEKNITKTTPLIIDDSEISSSTMNISLIKNKHPIGFISYNPLLKNITEYLVEEDDTEEEELLGNISKINQNNSNIFEIDKELTKVLDRLILYLRVVHSVDYYNGTEYTQEDSMPNRCGVIHVRGIPLSSITQNELTNFIQQFEIRLKALIDFHEKLDNNEALKLGAKNEENEIEKFININCQEISKDKWSCPLSGKKFKGPEFVRKHILNKHQDKLDEVKKEVIYFNNYLYDPKRPQLPEHPSNKPGATPTGSNISGLPLPTPMAAQPLLTRTPIWPPMTAPPHSGPSGYYPNQFHQIRHPRPPFMYQGIGGPPGGPIHRPPSNRPLRSYEDLDAPNEI